MRNKLARGSLALLTAAASVAGITTAASAAHLDATDLPAGSVGGYNITWTAVGTPVGDLNPSSYTLVKGNGELDFVMFGQGFTQDSFQDITLHNGTCAVPGTVVDTFEIDPAIRPQPANDPSPRATATANVLTQGTAGTLRFTQGSTVTSMDPADEIFDFEHDYKIIIRERGALATNYICGTPVFDENTGGSGGSLVGTEYPYVFKGLNGSGTEASGIATLIGNILSVNFSYTDLSLVPSQHFQVLVSGATCPAGNTATEAEVAGTIEASLTWNPRSILPADGLSSQGFSVSVSPEADGSLVYAQRIPLTQTQSDNFATSIVTVHGFDQNGDGTSNGGNSPVDPAMRADETAVAGCGQFVTTAPAVPAAPTAAVDADSVTVTWVAPFNGGSAITGYTVALSNGDEQTVAAGVTEATFNGLDDGNYTATVLATNAIGSSAASAASNSVAVDSSGLTPATAVLARPVGQKLIVSWTAPAPAPDSYTVTLAPGGASKTVTATNATFEDLAVDTYVASVVANYGSQSSIAALSAGAIIRDCQDGDVDADWDARVVTAANGSLFRLYCGYFLRYPDDGGWDYWSGIQAGGADLIAISDEFALSQEFLNTYGSLNNDQFVRLLYQNVLLRDVEQEGYDYWKNFLDTGQLTQGGTMRWVAEGAEFQAVTGTP